MNETLESLQRRLKVFESLTVDHERNADESRRMCSYLRQRIEDLSKPQEPQNLHDAVFYIKRNNVGEVARRNASGAWECSGTTYGPITWDEIVAKAKPGTLRRLEPGEVLN